MKEFTLSQALVWLSSKKEHESLVRSFLEIMKSVTGADFGIFYELFSERGDKEFYAYNAENIQVYSVHKMGIDAKNSTAPVEKIRRSVEKGKPLLILNHENGSSELFYPIRGKEGFTRVVYLVSSEFMEQETVKNLFKLVSIFGHNLELIKRIDHDHLTGLKNRIIFSRRIHEIILKLALTPADQKQKYLVVFDIDNFKRINIEFGYTVGDEVLLHTSRLMESNFRFDGETFRYGGEEFLVILEAAGEKEAKEKLEAFRKLVSDYHYANVKHVTISAGFTAIQSTDSEMKLLERSDRALFYGKANGRNQIHGWEDLIRSEKINDEVQNTGDVVFK